MSRRAKTKNELLASIRTTRELLDKKFSKLTPKQMVWPGSMDDWSVKDILAHLVDWEQRLVGWYRAGQRGEIPETPAPGYTWRELPRLNREGFEQHKDETLETVLVRYEKSYLEILELVEGMEEEEIFEAKYYEWTGDSSLLPWIAANTSSHYNWARRNIRTTVITKECK
ncbi:MAG: ClbS/DfsB family four-helix bundle protein [Anaerolineae bacterium]|jgi:hypothetical protein